MVLRVDAVVFRAPEAWLPTDEALGNTPRGTVQEQAF
jgi:hypothetical protein